MGGWAVLYQCSLSRSYRQMYKDPSRPSWFHCTLRAHCKLVLLPLVWKLLIFGVETWSRCTSTRLITGLLGPAAAETGLDGSSCCPGDEALSFCYRLRSSRPCQHQSLPASCTPLRVSGCFFESVLEAARFSCRQWLWNTGCSGLSESPMLSPEGPHAVRQPWPWLQGWGVAAWARAGTWFTSNSHVLCSLVVLLMAVSK